MKSERSTVTLSQAASLLGRDRATLRRWIRQGCPAVRDGARGWSVDLGALLAWREARAKDEARKSAEEEIEGLKAALGGEVTTHAEAVRRKRVAEAQMRELELGERQRKLLRYEDVVQGWQGTRPDVQAELVNGLHRGLSRVRTIILGG